MTRMANEYERADHDRDIRKHDTLPDRFRVTIPMALEVAMLARSAGVSLTDAANLIEQYARTAASEARIDAVMETSARMLAQIDKFGRTSDAQA